MRQICHGAGVYTVDTEHLRPHVVASYLIVDHGRAAFVDTGVSASVPNLLAALDELDIDRADVDYVLLTHIHLDHAGGAGRFDPHQLHASISRIAALEPKSVYLTHYSRVGGIEKLAADLHADVDTFVKIAQDAAAAPDRVRRIESEMYDHLCRRLDAHGFPRDEASRHAMLDIDVSLNAQGLDSWLTRIAA